MEQHYLVIDTDSTIINIIVWDGVLYDPVQSPQGWTPPEGSTIVCVGESPSGYYVGDMYKVTVDGANDIPQEDTLDPTADVPDGLQ